MLHVLRPMARRLGSPHRAKAHLDHAARLDDGRGRRSHLYNAHAHIVPPVEPRTRLSTQGPLFPSRQAGEQGEGPTPSMLSSFR
jgi:hypothetical protein